MSLPFTLIITDNGDTARLEFATHEEALQMKRAFDNYGKYQSVQIIRTDAEDGNEDTV